MAKTASVTPADFIKKTLGSIMLAYYAFVDRFHMKPFDLEELVDGLLFIDVSNFIKKKAYDDAQARIEAKRRNG